jgi:hypothetical protein
MQATRKSLAEVLVQLRAEGPYALVRGMRATMYRAFLVNAAIFYGYSVACRALTPPGPDVLRQDAH